MTNWLTDGLADWLTVWLTYWLYEWLTDSMTDWLFYLSSGGNGYINEYPAGRLLRDAKLYEIGAGTSEIRRMIIGRAFNQEFKN